MLLEYFCKKAVVEFSDTERVMRQIAETCAACRTATDEAQLTLDRLERQYH